MKYRDGEDLSMWKKWVLYVANVIVIGVLVQQVMTTTYLAKIDAGLHSSLHSTKQLASIESSIIEKNHALQGMASTTKSMSDQLGVTLQVTMAINKNIHAIDALNQSTLDVNQILVALGKQSQVNLASIASRLDQLNGSIGQVGGQLSQLKQTIELDASTLHDMKAQTDKMNSKVPGVTQ
jgi:D-ribose pyranose/furanose isomerase RbsD